MPVSLDSSSVLPGPSFTTVAAILISDAVTPVSVAPPLRPAAHSTAPPVPPPSPELAPPPAEPPLVAAPPLVLPPARPAVPDPPPEVDPPVGVFVVAAALVVPPPLDVVRRVPPPVGAATTAPVAGSTYSTSSSASASNASPEMSTSALRAPAATRWPSSRGAIWTMHTALTRTPATKAATTFGQTGSDDGSHTPEAVARTFLTPGCSITPHLLPDGGSLPSV
jgi:hypothetical protein